MSAIDRLNEIEARANAATEGPWESDEYTEIDPDGFYELSRVIAPDPDDGEDYAIGVVHVGILRPDATFIAHARTDVPALVAALREALEFAERWEASPAVGYNSAEQWEFDTLRDAGRDLRAAIEEKLS